MRGRFSVSILVALFVTGCSGGDINIQPTTIDNSVINPGGGGNDQCASYTNAGGQTLRGQYDAPTGGCRYSSAFLDSGKALEIDMTIPALTNGAPHIFQGSLFVGRAYDNEAALSAAGITKGGDGPTLTIEAGATLAFQSQNQFLVINRGAQILAVGRADAPITLTSVSDINGSVGAEDVQQWGGVIINGFGVTNKCDYTGTRSLQAGASGLTAPSGCNVASEGSAGLDSSWHGGVNDDDSSGRLEYVVVKHTGAQVAAGDELNGINFSAVGRNTTVRNIQVYSTYDDGIEIFGGAVNIENLVAVYARDDSIDLDAGYIGSITNALVIQQRTDGNRCIEADGIASYSSKNQAAVMDFITRRLNTRPTITNLTCIISPNETGTHDPGAGWRLREAVWPTIVDSMVIATHGTDSAKSNACFRIDDDSQQAAQDGNLVFDNNIFVCEDRTGGNSLPNGTTTEQWAITAGNQFATVSAVTDPTSAADTNLMLLEGSPAVYSVPFAQMMVDDAAPLNSPKGTFIGAVLQADDWLRPSGTVWVYGIFDGQRAQPLWFE